MVNHILKLLVDAVIAEVTCGGDLAGLLDADRVDLKSQETVMDPDWPQKLNLFRPQARENGLSHRGGSIRSA